MVRVPDLANLADLADFNNVSMSCNSKAGWSYTIMLKIIIRVWNKVKKINSSQVKKINTYADNFYKTIYYFKQILYDQ